MRDIIEAADDVAQLIDGFDAATFLVDRRTRAAVVWHLATIGEAAANIPDDMRLRYRDVPWSRIVGFRHTVIHRYFGIDRTQVWAAATSDAPLLRVRVTTILEAEDPDWNQEAQ